jgi:hypothetical protein
MLSRLSLSSITRVLSLSVRIEHSTTKIDRPAELQIYESSPERVGVDIAKQPKR